MSGYAPEAVTACFNTVLAAYPSAEYGGIEPGEVTCPSEYHYPRDALRLHEYSTSLADDLEGDGQACAGLDIVLDVRDLITFTHRLIDATMAADTRVWCLREFIGSLNGFDPSGMYVRERRWLKGVNVTDLRRLHLSFYRAYTDDHACMQMVAAVMINGNGRE